MNTLTSAFAASLMKSASHTPFKGLGTDFGATSNQLELENPNERFRQAIFEEAGVEEFFKFFSEDLPHDIVGKRVLDFGCGYGGKAVAYATRAKSVVGTEPFPHMIELAQAYGKYREASNLEFVVCTQDNVPCPDNFFDVVVSHDVLEHVDDPSVSLGEIARVLRPGGRAYIAFPPYDGMLSHHLDYISRVPAIHWLFSADTLVSAVNKLLDQTGGWMKPQPAPKLSWDRRRKVLPQLNGLTGPQFQHLAAGLFSEVSARPRMIAQHRGGVIGTLCRLGFTPLFRRGGVARDRVTGTIAAVLRK